jgi:hypothetical protein
MKMKKIRRELKYATFEYDEDERSIMIETRTTSDAFKNIASAGGEFDLPRPTNGRIKLNKVYSFALLRFVIRIAQRNWFRKMKKVLKGEDDIDGYEDIKAFSP